MVNYRGKIKLKEFIYDNSFEGLLTAIFYAYTEKDLCIITRQKNFLPNLLNDIYEINTEIDKFERVYSSIINKLNNSILINIYHLYLSDIKDCDTLILKYLKLCYNFGPSINLAKNNDIIILVDKYCRRVKGEAHRFTGFVRFKEIAPLSFYASIEPDHNILPLIINHFSRRFSDQNFIIHDLKRDLAIIYNKKESMIIDFKREDADSLISNKNDFEFEKLWRTFYSSVNIKERENLRLRSQHMPKRYWNHLTELK